MKKILILVVVFLALGFGGKAYASVETPTPTVVPTPVNYELPYPGILPGSPFYSLKTLKEKISDFLISDPATKADFYLHQSDKRLAAAIVLFENGENELGEETISRGLDYHEKAIDKMIEAKKAQDNVEGIYGQIKDSCKKHEEEMVKINEENAYEKSKLMKENEQRLKEIQNRVNSFSP